MALSEVVRHSMYLVCRMELPALRMNIIKSANHPAHCHNSLYRLDGETFKKKVS